MPPAAEPDPLYVSVGEAIRAVRGAMSQDDLAAAIGKNQRTLSAYESGRVPVPLHLVPLIERTCGASMGTVFRRAGLVDDRVEAVLGSDPDLSDYGRKAMVSYYRFTRDEFDPAKATP